MTDYWSERFVLSGLAVEKEQLIRMGYDFRDCLKCGATVADEHTQAHEDWHEAVEIKIGRVANNGRVKLN